jgi:hypothetical protein
MPSPTRYRSPTTWTSTKLSCVRRRRCSDRSLALHHCERSRRAEVARRGAYLCAICVRMDPSAIEIISIDQVPTPGTAAQAGHSGCSRVPPQSALPLAPSPLPGAPCPRAAVNRFAGSPLPIAGRPIWYATGRQARQRSQRRDGDRQRRPVCWLGFDTSARPGHAVAEQGVAQFPHGVEGVECQVILSTKINPLVAAKLGSVDSGRRQAYQGWRGPEACARPY